LWRAWYEVKPMGENRNRQCISKGYEIDGVEPFLNELSCSLSFNFTQPLNF
jgi:hypothetical protein